LSGEFGKEADLLGNDGNVAFDQLRDRAGGRDRFEPPQRKGLFLDQIRPTVQRIDALARHGIGPAACLQRLLGRLYGTVDQTQIRDRASAAELAVGRSPYLQCACRSHPLTADKVTKGELECIGVEAQRHGAPRAG
jgi:hypothetical protein